MHSFILTTSWDDGSLYDEKLADLLIKYKIPATFYIPVKNSEREVLGAAKIKNLSRNFEIGGHTLHHSDLTGLSFNAAYEEIRKGKKVLEKIVGRKINSFCYPRGKYNPEVKQLVGYSGFEYARTTRLFGSGITDKLSAPTSVHAYSHLGLDWEVFGKLYFNFVKAHGGVFHFWGHSWEIEENGDWGKLERFLGFLQKNTKPSERLTNFETVRRLTETKRSYYEEKPPEHSGISVNLSKMLIPEDKSGKRIVDLGSGNGEVSKYFMNASYLGFDYSAKLIKFAVKKYGKKNHQFKIKDLSIPPEVKADLILILGLFEDFTNPLGYIKKLKFKKIIFTLYDGESVEFIFKSFLKRLLVKNYFPYTSFTVETVKRLAKKESIKNIKTTKKGESIIVQISNDA